MRLLLLLAEKPGAVLSVEQMLSEVWQGVIVSSASVYQAVSQLRRLLGDTDPEPTYIATVPRKGYRLIASVAPVTPPAPAPSSSPPSGAGSLTPEPVMARRRNNLMLTMIVAAIVLFGAAGWFAWHRYVAEPTAVAQSIVVLPFVDMTEKREDQFFCDGLTEELSNWLAQIPTLRVVARTSAFAFRDQRDARQIGRELNTTHVLEGSMRRFGDHVRITAQLIDARTGYHVWSSEYDREQEDTIRVQEDIARAVAESLQIRLTQDTTRKFAERRSANSQAYEVYLLARHYQQDRTRESNLRAIDLYQQALAADPNFALAYVGLAYANLNQVWLDARTLAEVSPIIEPLLEVAERLDPQLSELFAVRGAFREEQRRRDEARRDLLRAVALNPNDVWAYAELGRLTLGQGHPRDALSYLTRALTLDPLDFTLHARRCIALQDLARYAEAASACARARALQGEGNFATIVSSWLEWSQGHLPEALQWNALAIKAAPNNMNLYELQADLLLTLGLPQAAREVYAQARTATMDGEAVDIGLSSVAYYEGGPDALRAHLAVTRLDDSQHSRTLIDDGYLHVLAGDPSGAKALIARAMSAPDFDAERLNDPWFARWGDSDLLEVAVCEMVSGQRDPALTHLKQITDVIDELLAHGEERYQIYALRAEVQALRGDSDGAMQALSKAASMGWRGAWWAEHEPFFTYLRKRDDFRALVTRINAGVRELRAQTHLPN
jgi:TolB-like protein/DNA-binding winged helix-turn-helix (wHTH) protein